MKNTLLIFILLITTNSVFSQENLFDVRDSITYDTKLIGGLVWMNENLKYKSKNSFCLNENKICKLGNYYSFSELDSIVPENYRVPNVSDWMNLIEEAFLQSNIDLSEMIVDTTENGSTRIRGINLFKAKNFIELQPTSWVQGGEIYKLYLKKKYSLATFWVVDVQNHSSLTHIHIKKDEIIIHAHEHNIIDEPDKVRMFSVRCVKK